MSSIINFEVDKKIERAFQKEPISVFSIIQ